MDTARVFTDRLAALLSDERAALADFIVALDEFDRERLWLTLGYASLFDFLHRELGLSRGAAHYRKTAAWLVRDFPEVVEPIRDGRLCCYGTNGQLHQTAVRFGRTRRRSRWADRRSIRLLSADRYETAA